MGAFDWRIYGQEGNAGSRSGTSAARDSTGSVKRNPQHMPGSDAEGLGGKTEVLLNAEDVQRKGWASSVPL